MSFFMILDDFYYDKLSFIDKNETKRGIFR